MGTVVTHRAHGILAPFAVRAASRALARLESTLSMYAPQSDISRFNRTPPGEWTAIGRETTRVLARAHYWAQASDGAFDPTAGAMSLLWKSHIDAGTVPDQSEIDGALSQTGYRYLALDEVSDHVTKAIDGLMIDLGGIAKGFAADAAVAVYRKYGVRSALVNMGGNVAAVGGAPGGKPWSVGVIDPWHPDRMALALSVRDVSVVTSGTYERYHEHQGVRFHHLLDPRTGRPSPASPLGSVTVVDANSCDADALATAVFVLGSEAGLALISAHREAAQAVLIMDSGEIIVTSGLKDAVSAVAAGFSVVARP